MTEENDSPTGEVDEEVKSRKRKERLEQNRISARESRKRKKSMIEELQRTVITLSRENKDLNERNEALRRQLMEIGAKYPNVMPMQALMPTQPTSMAAPGQAPAAAPTPGDANNAGFPAGMFFVPGAHMDQAQLAAQVQQAQQQQQAQAALSPTGEAHQI